jgi:hypothetical protein
MYPPWMWGYPTMMGQGMEKSSEDPIRQIKKWMKFLKAEEEGKKKKEKEKEKKSEPWEQIHHISAFLLASMIIVGPTVYLVVHLINSSLSK